MAYTHNWLPRIMDNVAGGCSMLAIHRFAMGKDFIVLLLMSFVLWMSSTLYSKHQYNKAVKHHANP